MRNLGWRMAVGGVALGVAALGTVTWSGVVEAAEIRGRVFAAGSKDPLAYASIQLTVAGKERGVLAGLRGEFRTGEIPGGRYLLRITYLGYAPATVELTLGPDETRNVEVPMQVEAIRMEEIEVRGNRNELAEEVQTGFVEIGSEELAAIPAFGEADPIRALQFLPGVQAASDISSGLYVRGGGPDQTLVLLDGVPVYNPTHAFGLFSSFHPDLIEELSLYKGAYPARYGGRLGAVLDIRSLEGEPGPVRGKLGVSTIASRLALEGDWKGKPWAVGARRTYLDPLLTVLRRSNRGVPSYWFGDLNGKISFPRSNGSTEIRGYLSRDVLGVKPDDDTSIDLAWGNLAASLEHRVLFGESRVWTASLFTSRYNSDADLRFLTTPVDFGNHLFDVSGETTFSFRLPPHHRITLGLSASRYDFAYDQNFNYDSLLDYSAEAWDFGLFAEDVWRPDPQTTIRAGARTRYLSDGDRVRVEPRLSMRRELSERWTAKLGGGLYNQVLQLVSTEGFSGADFYLPIDETAQPSRSWQLVGGFEYTPRPSWQISLEGYHTWLRDLVRIDNELASDEELETAQQVFLTGGSGWAAGAEFFLQKRMGSWTGWVGYTLGWTRREFPELNEGKEFPPKYDRRHDLNFVLRKVSGKWEYGATFVYATGQAFTPASARYGIRNPATGESEQYGELLAADLNSSRLTPYHRLDLSVRRNFSFFGLNAYWSAQAFNLYSHRNDWFVTYDADEPGATPEIVRQLPVVPSLGLEVEF